MLIKTEYTPGANRNEMVRFVTNKPKKSLEVGCREAKHSKLLKETFSSLAETWGIEPDDNPILITEAERNLDFFINDYLTENTEGLKNNYFDLVVFNDVLEHMYDPWEVLINTKGLLTEDGIVVISLPNIRHKSVLFNLIFKDDFEYQKQGLLDVTHIRFFTAKTMIKLLEDCGYEIVKMERTNDYKNKPLKRFFKNLKDTITPPIFRSMNVFQYGITARVKKD